MNNTNPSKKNETSLLWVKHYYLLCRFKIVCIGNLTICINQGFSDGLIYFIYWTDRDLEIRRAARFVTNNYTDRTPGCVTNMITSLGWQSLEQRRHNSRLCMLYKIQHNLIDINRDLYIRHNDSRTRGQHRLFQERTNNETYRNSFFQRTVRDWNLLPTSTVAAATIEEFRANLMVSPASC
jgi:hypothetical protein